MTKESRKKKSLQLFYSVTQCREVRGEPSIWSRVVTHKSPPDHGLHNRGNVDQFLVQTRNSSFLQFVQTVHPNQLFNRNRGLFPLGLSGRFLKLTSHLHLVVSRLRMSKVLHPGSYISS